MNPRPGNAPEPILLILADISGYTRYMTANAKTLAHSQAIITELVHVLIGQVSLPLEVAKLEGDAIFLFCRKQNAAGSWSESKRVIGDQLLEFFHRFSEKVGELGRSTTCTCHACAHIEGLQLKIVVHGGEALFHRVLNFVELAGVDVIIAHRLLKNSVTAGQYLLLTEAARRDLEFSRELHFVESAENYADIGLVNTLVYLPNGDQPVVNPPADASVAKRFSQSWKLFCRLWFAPFVPRPAPFRNLTVTANPAGKVAFALLTAWLTPFYLPVGMVFAFFHALAPSRQNPRPHTGHEHKPDGSCCHRHKLKKENW
jgi:hypothetical protein